MCEISKCLLVCFSLFLVGILAEMLFFHEGYACLFAAWWFAGNCSWLLLLVGGLLLILGGPLLTPGGLLFIAGGCCCLRAACY